jgi:hypothetical protein
MIEYQHKFSQFAIIGLITLMTLLVIYFITETYFLPDPIVGNWTDKGPFSENCSATFFANHSFSGWCEDHGQIGTWSGTRDTDIVTIDGQKAYEIIFWTSTDSMSMHHWKSGKFSIMNRSSNN